MGETGFNEPLRRNPGEQSPERAHPGELPAVGAIVHYVRSGAPNKGCCRPAIVCAIHRADRYELNLHVLLDGSNDVPRLNRTARDGLFGTQWMERVRFSDQHKPGTWHWPGATE
jgi:hypothetical protein